jgi:ribosomal protein S18 acetylase RimI-like enzyme
MAWDLVAYNQQYLPALVTFWNRTFGDHLNAIAVDETLLRARVFDKRTDLEQFEPSNFIMAVRDGVVLGVIHFGRRAEDLCRAIWPDWSGGSQGYIALLGVLPEERKKGIGDALWHRAMKELKSVSRIDVDGQCISPFYGNSEGPFTPLFGTPEGISIPANDTDTHRFLGKRGYRPEYQGIHLRKTLDGSSAEIPERGDVAVHIFNEAYPDIDAPLGSTARYMSEFNFRVVTAVRGEDVIGIVGLYPMAELGVGRWAIYETLVSESARGEGIGGLLVKTAIRHAAEVEKATTLDVLTLPEVSGPALKMYRKLGFIDVETWSVFGRKSAL